MTGARGFQNLETLFKYRLFKNVEHEFVVSAGLEIEWGGSGAQSVGAERFNVYTPTLYFGKGFGDLPSSLNWARPFAITGQVGYAIPGVSKTHDRHVQRGDRRTGRRHGISSTRARLGCHAAIQHAVSEIRGRRSRPARFFQSPCSDR